MALADVADPGWTPPHANRFEPSATTMIAGWVDCDPQSSSNCRPNLTDEDTVRGSSGDTFTLPAATGTVYPWVAFSCGTTDSSGCAGANRPTVTTPGGDAVTFVNWPYGAASRAAGWAHWFTYVYSATSQDDPAATDYVITRPVAFPGKR